MVKLWRITLYTLSLSSLQEAGTHLHREGTERGRGTGCQLQPEGADGDAVLGLEKCSE